MKEPTLMLGDCLELMGDIPDGSVDMVLADPPYGTTACKWDSMIPLEPMWAHLKRVIKPNGAIVMTASQPFTTTLIHSNMRMFKYCWVWDKCLSSGELNANRLPMKRHEDIVVFGKKGTVYNPSMTTGRMRTKGGGRPSQCYGKVIPTKSVNDQYFPTSIIRISNANHTGRVHPTQKPVALMEYLIHTYTNPGETVLDFAMGSGTTGVACKNLGRDFIGIEQDAGYFGGASKRIADTQPLLLKG